MINIKIGLSSDDIGQLVDDLAYANALAEQKQEVLLPFTRELIQKIIRKAEKKAVRMVKTGSEFSEACEEWAQALDKEGEKDGI
jgi:hypothetical protein